MKSLKSQASSLKNPVIHVLRSLGEGGSCRNPEFRDFTYRTYKTYTTYQFASSKKGNPL